MSYLEQIAEHNERLEALKTVAEELPAAGPNLPELTNPAGAEQILAGYQAINGEGMLTEGTALGTAISATESTVQSGKTYYDETGQLHTGTSAAEYAVMSGSFSSTATQTITAPGTVYAVLVWVENTAL